MACAGQIILGEASSAFRNTLRELLQQGAKKLVIDMSEVTYLDSTGIGELVGAYTSAHNVQAQIKLSGLPQKIHDLLQITRLDTIFEIAVDRAAAVRSFS
jgi:anti-sigma B factor antagonist